MSHSVFCETKSGLSDWAFFCASCRGVSLENVHYGLIGKWDLKESLGKTLVKCAKTDLKLGGRTCMSILWMFKPPRKANAYSQPE